MTGDGPLGALAGRVAGAERRLAPVDDWLANLRADDGRRRLALAGAVVVGLALAWLHWTGLVVGGALVGLTRRKVRWAVVGGVAFGLVATGAGVIVTPTIGVAEFARLQRLAGVTVIVGVLAAGWGSLLRAAL